MVAEEFDMRFGNLAVEKGFITIDQLVAMRNSQFMTSMTEGSRKSIGMILLEEGFINMGQVNEVIQTLNADLC
jgi:hypothetical protein